MLTQRLVASNRAIIARLKQTLASIKTKGLKGNALSSAQKHQTDTRSAISTYQGNLSRALGDLTSAGDDRDSSWISLLQEQAERASVAGTQAQPVVAAATAVDTTGAATAASDQTTALLQQLLTQSQQTTAVSQAQYRCSRTSRHSAERSKKAASSRDRSDHPERSSLTAASMLADRRRFIFTSRTGWTGSASSSASTSNRTRGRRPLVRSASRGCPARAEAGSDD